ncbi:MAG: hypothetical protein LC793_16195 [Thermomicrobia bacterium]|nr:hypothetical protein [Thermomicrobia bacterium]MCA1725137.1 hypothetical protein [Thermomicrobia bacterium]
MHETFFRLLTIAQDLWQNLALVGLGSLVLRQEKRWRKEQRLIRRTHDAIMREMNQ